MKKTITVLALCLSFSLGFAQFLAPDKNPVDSSKILKNKQAQTLNKQRHPWQGCLCFLYKS